MTATPPPTEDHDDDNEKRPKEVTMTTNTITITFTTDRPLTDDEVDSLITTLFAQVEEPQVDDGNEYVDATYTTSGIGIVHGC